MGQVGVKSVESAEEFNALLPQLVLALKSNKDEWGYEYNLTDMLEMMNGNRHMLFYGGELYNVLVFGFYIVETFSTQNRLVKLMWSWAKGEIFEDGILAAGEALAKCNGAERIEINACKRLARRLINHGYKAEFFNMVKEI